jgi:hypothetical protein
MLMEDDTVYGDEEDFCIEEYVLADEYLFIFVLTDLSVAVVA